jgi:hypothetical protein
MVVEGGWLGSVGIGGKERAKRLFCHKLCAGYMTYCADSHGRCACSGRHAPGDQAHREIFGGVNLFRFLSIGSRRAKDEYGNYNTLTTELHFNNRQRIEDGTILAIIKT